MTELNERMDSQVEEQHDESDQDYPTTNIHDFHEHEEKVHMICGCIEPTPAKKLCGRQFVLGLFFLLGCTELIFSIKWLHYLGLLGSIILLTATVSLIIETGVRQYRLNKFDRPHFSARHPPRANCCCKLARNFITFVSLLIAIYVVILITVRLLSFQHVPSVDSWPSGCREETKVSCCRIALDCNTSNLNDGHSALWLDSDSHEVTGTISHWADSQFQMYNWGTFQHSPNATVLHYEIFSSVWGFADDLFIELRTSATAPHACTHSHTHHRGRRLAHPAHGGGTLTVQIQSEQRFGQADAGVNQRRALALYARLNQTYWH